jgi:uncharacterized membrane protein
MEERFLERSAIIAGMSAVDPSSSAPPRRSWVPRLLLVLLAIGILLVWLTYTPHGLLGKADAVGYAVCHRIDLRSFHLGERALPLCSRCTGMYLGSSVAFVFLLTRGRVLAGQFPRRWLLAVLCLMAGLFAIDGVNSYLSFFPRAPHLYAPNNTLRLLAGTGLGIAMGVLVAPGFNQAVWARVDSSRSLESWLDLALLMLAALGVDLLVLTENPLVLYPLALISSAGVVFLLTIVYTMLVILLSGRENTVAHPRQLLAPALAGLVLAMLQIAGLDVVRYLLTGTWGGFAL